jgi:hypothetical protein
MRPHELERGARHAESAPLQILKEACDAPTSTPRTTRLAAASHVRQSL